MLEVEKQNVLRAAIETYGPEAQTKMLLEEMSELQKEICKIWRGYNNIPHIAEDGLSQNWGGYSVFCNPPYGREISKWVKKGFEEAQKPGTKVVMLLPARTDTKWFHDYCVKGKIEFLKGRLKFGNAGNPAPFPSMIVIFGS